MGFVKFSIQFCGIPILPFDRVIKIVKVKLIIIAANRKGIPGK